MKNWVGREKENKRKKYNKEKGISINFVQIYLFSIDVTSKDTLFSLVVPLFNPVNWTKWVICSPEDFTWGEIFTFYINTLVVINIGLPAMLSLILLRESSIETDGVQWRFLGLSLGGCSVCAVFFAHYLSEMCVYV